MKISLCNVPLRADNLKTTYPPLGAMAVIQSLSSAGHQVDFFDINFFRPTEERIRSYLLEHRFDIVGISATISTSYGYVKKLSGLIKSVLPDSVIIVGGALTASAEIVLSFTDVDYCVIGEGERVALNLAAYIASYGKRKITQSLKMIKGICFKDDSGELVFTGYEQQLGVQDVLDPDYSILENYSDISNYIIDPFYYEQFKYDQRSFQPHRKGKKLATVVSSRGCVNRCTFCHRWQQGIRIFPVKRVIEHIRELTRKYDVGFISFGDEDFGATRKWLEEFIESIAPLDVLYRISGACVTNVDMALLERLKQSGCVAIHYGFESGSNSILKVMEKNADVDSNIRVGRMTNDTGLQTVIALVVGMPGESSSTIKETIGFVKKITETLPRKPILSVNALVALPGAPVYEYARYRGFLGKDLRDEERYLLQVSNQGGESLKLLNLTDYPYFLVQAWIRYIYWEVAYNYCVKNRLGQLTFRGLCLTVWERLTGKRGSGDDFSGGLLSNRLMYKLRYIICPVLVMRMILRADKALFGARMLELIFWPFRRKFFPAYVPLRGFLAEKTKSLKGIAPNDIKVLRGGR